MTTSEERRGRGDGRRTHDALPLRTVSRMTGLSPDVIRAWEKRYAVVAPKRGPRGARLYTASDVSHLRLLGQVVSSGRAIGDVAKLARPELETLADLGLEGDTASRARARSEIDVVAQAIDAVQRFDVSGLDRCLGRALIVLGAREFVGAVAAPLLEEVGQRWSDGRLSVADEHLLSGLLRTLLASLLRARQTPGAPTVLLATPSGERHEFGLLLAGLLIAEAGLALCYLGTDLPAADVATAARRANVAVVGLSVINGENRREAVAAVRRVERELPARTELWLGGREAAAVVKQLGTTRAVVLDRPASIEAELARVRALAAART